MKAVPEKIIIILYILIIVACTLCCGSCTKTPVHNITRDTESYVLNKRQIDILKKENLPTNYEQLNTSQKSSIEAIERLFCYLDKKYPYEQFSYKGYVSNKSPMDNEHLSVYSQYGVVTVYRNNENNKSIITDDYNNVKISFEYSSIIDKYISGFIDNNRFAVETKAYVSKNKKHSVFYSNASINLYLNETITKKKYIKVLNNTIDYLSKNVKGIVSVNFYLTKKAKFDYYCYKEDESFDISDFIEVQYFRNSKKQLSKFIKE